MTKTALGFPDTGIAGLVSLWTSLPIAGNARDDQAWIDGLQDLRAEPPLLKCSGPEILNQHIRRGRKTLQDVLSLGEAQIERD